MVKQQKYALLDTSVIISAMADSEVFDLIKNYLRYINPVLIGELIFGAKHSANPDKNIKRVTTLIEQFGVLDITENTALNYANIRKQLREDGKSIPENDLWMAATGGEHLLPLMTLDKHFENIKELKLLKV